MTHTRNLDKSNSGLFICFEGVDGSGKTTQARRLVETLKQQGIDAVYTREPGGTPVAEALRSVVMTPLDTEMISATTELLIMFAARQQHLDHFIRPTLAQGTWVICDRFVDSTFGYQVTGREQDPTLFYILEQHVVGNDKPDLTLFLDLDENISQQRLSERIEESNRLDRETLEFYRRARHGLRERARLPAHHHVDAGGDVDEVHRRVLTTLAPYLNVTLTEPV